ncbi:MAG TPA: hypothetical protein VGN88_10290 [Phycisphaerae bacterium]|jgi:ribose transport system permease protein
MSILFILVAFFLLILCSLILALFFSKAGSTPPYFQERIFWRLGSQVVWLLAIGVLVGVPVFLGIAMSSAGMSAGVVQVIFRNGLEIALVALPCALLLARGQFDMSTAGVVAVCSVVLIAVGNKESFVVGCAAALGIGLLMGVINGLIVSISRLSSVIVTFAVGSLLVGIARWISDDRALTFDLSGSYAGISNILAWLVLLIEIIGLFVLAEFTSLGRRGKVPSYTEGVRFRLLTAGIPLVISALASGVLAIHFVTYVRTFGGGGSFDWRFLLSLLAAVMGGTVYGSNHAAIVGTCFAAFYASAMRTLIEVLVAPPYLEPLLLSAALLTFALVGLQYHNLVAWLHHRRQPKTPLPGFPVQ